MVGDPGSRPKDRRVQIKVPPRGSPSVARAVAILNAETFQSEMMENAACHEITDDTYDDHPEQDLQVHG